MAISTSLAVVAVADLEVSRDFYARLLDRPPDLEPMPGLAQWDLEPAGGVQVVEDAERRGSSLLTLLVTDLDGLLAAVADRGIATEGVIEGAVSRVAQAHDPDGNVITLAELYT